MPRGPRLRLPDVPLHIVQRGHNRSRCFFRYSDYRFYLDQLAALSTRFDCCVHAYVLMTNHVHLLVSSAAADSPSLLMKHLGQRYVHYVNRIQGRTGTLWEGRFRSSLVQQDRYLFACYRYIELNPVRAGMVEHPEDYEWSSYRCNAGLTRSRIVRPHPAYLDLGCDDHERGRAYRALFPARQEDGDLGEIRVATNAGFAVGDDAFKARLALGRRVRPGQRGRPPA